MGSSVTLVTPPLRLEYADLNIPLRAGIAIIAFSLNYNIIRIYIYIHLCIL